MLRVAATVSCLRETVRGAELAVCSSLQEMSRRGAVLWVDVANAAIAEHGRFAVALSGGSTPRSLYALLASEFLDRVAWKQVHCFWSDERCVPPGHPESNYRAAHEGLLSRVDIPAGNVHRMRGEDDPPLAAADYDRELRSWFGAASAPPRFDLMMLGMGADGHTASLFPGSPAINEQHAWAAANYVEKLKAYRLTLTFPVLNASAVVMLLVAGEDKAPALAKVLSEGEASGLPAARVHPQGGRMLWIVDEAAAAVWMKR
jgi:6-phosphogluconolactonase